MAMEGECSLGVKIIKMWGKYMIKIECDNCGFKNKLYCKKGVTVGEFIKSEHCKCRSCGCVVNVKEYSTEFIK